MLKYFACFTVLVLQSVSLASEQVRVQGVVKDVTSDKILPGMVVELYVLEQPSRLRMGTFVLRKEVRTDTYGRFEFIVPPRSTIQLRTQTVPKDVAGSLVVLDVEDTDVANIVLTYDPSDLKTQSREGQ